MLEELLKKCFDEDLTADKSAENIKTAVLSRIEEEKPMKHFTIKPLLIAAAITATGAVTLATANAATDGAVMDQITKTFSFFINGEEVEATLTKYSVGDDGHVEQIEITLPDDVPANIVVYEDEDGNMKVLEEDQIESGFVVDYSENS